MNVTYRKRKNRIILILIFVLEAILIPTTLADDSNYTIAFIDDAKPSTLMNSSELIKDLNQIIPQSPTGRVDAIVAIGDMNRINSTESAHRNSTTKNITIFYSAGNHELRNTKDIFVLRDHFRKLPYNPIGGPKGTRNTTYSFNVDKMHVIVLNEYWDGDNDGNCDWYTPSGGKDLDDSCFKYSTVDGGFIPYALYKWIKKDLNISKDNFSIVVGHEPLYPWGGHVGSSLDKNITNRDELQNLFKSKNVSAFIGGHTHHSGFRIKDKVVHANAGVFGDNADTGDGFASIIYTWVNASYMFIEHVYENDTWDNVGRKRLVINKTS